MEKRQIYFDNNATTPVHPEVKKAILNAIDNFGNPSSLHAFGRKARQAVELSRQVCADFISAASDEIIFMGSGSEANNSVLSMFGYECNRCSANVVARKTIITTAIEHPCIMESSKCLVERGIQVHYLKVNSRGKVDLGQLHSLLNESVGLVSIMMANNEIGTIQDIKEISDMVHLAGGMMHTDAVQAVGKIDVNVNDLGVDFLTFSGHKFYGPKGIAGLYVKKGTSFCPFIRGGHQERGRRAGTENTLGIIGLAEAIRMRKLEMKGEEVRLKAFKEMIKESITKNIDNVYFNGDAKDCLVSTLNVSFEGAEGEAILLYLDLEGISVSTGSACALDSLDPSHVLLACGLKAEQAHGSIRISLGRQTTKEEIDYFNSTLPQVLKKVRGLSTAYSENK